MGTPIIGANVAGIGDAFRGLPGCHLIPRDDPDAFAAAVESATDGAVEMPRDVFADRFDMHANYGQYATVYERLAGQQQ
jgi:glycosyltransferase involved in cell wall biosynthesis